VFILKEVKVICFHTLLQVLILKVVVAAFCDPFAKCVRGKPLEDRGKLDLLDFKGLAFSRGEPFAALGKQASARE
jgi:hypothetical protein